MRVFISSTYDDLIEHRKKVHEELERLGQYGVRMEVFGARPEDAWVTCSDEIDSCDAFVGIYAHRYGYIPDHWDVSITEKEFDYAQERKKPTFCFVVDDNHPWVPAKIEAEPGRSKLNNFKDNRIGKAVVFDRFTTPDDLAKKVANAVSHFIIAGFESKPYVITYDWIISYSNSMSNDWLARQTREIQDMIKEYILPSGIQKDLPRDRKALDLLAEYHGYQIASGRVLQGTLFCKMADTVIEGCASLTFEQSGYPTMIQIDGFVRSKMELELSFRQQPRVIDFGDDRVGLIKAFNYGIVFQRKPVDSLTFKGLLYHPDYGDFEIAKTTLIPRIDE